MGLCLAPVIPAVVRSDTTSYPAKQKSAPKRDRHKICYTTRFVWATTHSPVTRELRRQLLPVHAKISVQAVCARTRVWSPRLGNDIRSVATHTALTPPAVRWIFREGLTVSVTAFIRYAIIISDYSVFVNSFLPKCLHFPLCCVIITVSFSERRYIFMLLMLAVVGLYTICSLNDKYAVSKAKYNGAQLTFLMAAGTVPFLLMTLPFSDTTLTMNWLAPVFVLLIALSKYLEFDMSAKILEQMSAFELKAWLGILLFVSYFTDILLADEALSIFKLLFIVLTTIGLVLIAVSGRGQVNYRKILIPLVLYLGARFLYGIVVKFAEGIISSTLMLLFALIILAFVMAPAAKPLTIAKNSPEGKKGVIIVILCKIPNALGLLGENAVTAESLTNAAFISPMMLISIFIVGLFSKSTRPTGLNLIGSIVCIIGILGFQLAGML